MREPSCSVCPPAGQLRLMLLPVLVTTAGAAGAVYDSATIGGIGAGNLIGVVPAAVGVYLFDWPVNFGIVYAPGAAQVASVSYE